MVYVDNTGKVPDDIFFKETFYLSGKTYRKYSELWKSMYPDMRGTKPESPIVEVCQNIICKLVESIPLVEKIQEVEDAYNDIVLPFCTYNQRNIDYYLQSIILIDSNPRDCVSAQIEMLYGSHSAELKVTCLYDDGRVEKYDPIITQCYNALLYLMKEMKNITEVRNGFYFHERAEWNETL